MARVRSLHILVFASLFAPVAKADLILNGGFESGSFVNTAANYMTLVPGDTDLFGWTIDSSIAWGINPTDGFIASSGAGFVDLSGLGNSSPTGAISQTVSTTLAETYLFTIDLQGGATSVFLNGIELALAAVASSGGWTTYSSSYTADSVSTTVSIRNRDGVSSVVFADNVFFGATAAPVPAPGTVVLLGLGLAGVGIMRRRRLGQP